jgi:hypothetical protein
VKKVIERLRTVYKRLDDIYGLSQTTQLEIVKETCRDIDRAIAELKAPPRLETPEQYRERTGKVWPEWWAVYARDSPHGVWKAYLYWEARHTFYEASIQIVCAGEAGCPPDDWKPEGAQ